MAAQWVDRVRSGVGIAVLSVIIIGLAAVARAAEWREPTAPPPAGNPPGFVWTLDPGSPPQAGGMFNIEGGGRIGKLVEAFGGGVFGRAALDLGAAAGGQNVIFGIARRSTMHADDALVLLQTADDTGVATDRFRVGGDGNVRASGTVGGSQLCIGDACKAAWPGGIVAGTNIAVEPSGGDTRVRLTDDVTVEKSITAKGCFGPVIRGTSATTSNGNVGGYVAANARCPAGQHVCTTSEVLQSIACGAVAGAGIADGTDIWIANLAPSLPTPTNDCVGWTKDTDSWRGIKWRLNATTGGAAYAESCLSVLRFACCS